ncbi:MAG: preprotein translocase subunit SecE [Chloroflexi bacterium]|nr:preprotein translocase subunit SecE [Chloroflexota bacterium]
MKLPRATAARGRGNPRFGFFKDTVSELKKVVWPTRREAINLTRIVIIASVAVGLTLAVIDFIFSRLVKELLVR